MTSLDFYFDFLSPYSYLAHTQLDGLGVGVRYVPVDVIGLMTLVGNTPTSLTCKAKRAYVGPDLMRWAKRYGVPFGLPNLGALNGNLLLRVAIEAQVAGLEKEVVTSLFDAVWGGSGKLADSDVAGLLEANGLRGRDLVSRADEESAATILNDNTGRAAQLGVFGVPTIAVDGELFFGNDRLDFVRERLVAMKRQAA